MAPNFELCLHLLKTRLKDLCLLTKVTLILRCNSFSISFNLLIETFSLLASTRKNINTIDKLYNFFAINCIYNNNLNMFIDHDYRNIGNSQTLKLDRTIIGL